MALTQNEILNNTRSVLKKVPFRTNFERDNFVYGVATGPRLLVSLCQEIEFLNSEHDKAMSDWQRDSILTEMNIINGRIAELQAEIGENITTAIEEAEPQFWVEELARKAAIEALTQSVSVENMGQMLKLPAELYEQTISRCQTFLNVINKTTRTAERQANLANVPTDSEE
jgi:hypothetical protein